MKKTNDATTTNDNDVSKLNIDDYMTSHGPADTADDDRIDEKSTTLIKHLFWLVEIPGKCQK